MFKVHDYKDVDKGIFFNFLKLEYDKSSDPARINMWHDDWLKQKNTLPYLLEKTKRFEHPKGKFFILTDNDHIIGCGGVYISDFHESVALCGTRLWLTESYRNKTVFKDTIFVENKLWAINNNCQILAMCFNDYNKSLIKTFTKIRLGENKDRIKTRKNHHLFYNGAIEVGFPVIIQNTKQWVVYEKINDFDFDWNSIRYS